MTARTYWTAYGGLRELFRSRYLWAAIVLDGICYGLWATPDWPSTVIQVIPSILGLTIAGLALFHALGSEGFRVFIAKREPDEDGEPPYVGVSATFVHFAVVQVVALMLAILAMSLAKLPAPTVEPLATINEWGRVALAAVSFAAFLYALLLAVAAVLGLYEMTQWFVEYATATSSSNPPNPPGQAHETVSQQPLPHRPPSHDGEPGKIVSLHRAAD